jgi:hypothetical protein
VVSGSIETTSKTWPAWYKYILATVVAYHIWGDLLQDHRIKFHCDNEAVVTIIDTKHSRIPRVMDLVRHLTLLTFQHNIHTTNSSYCVSVVYHPPEPINNESDLLDFYRNTVRRFCYCNLMPK